MTAYLYCRVTDTAQGRALIPSDRKSEELLSQVKPGRTVLVKTKSARNPKQHRLLWALAAKIAENSDRFEDAEHVVHELKINTGHVSRRQIRVPGLGIVFQEWPKSISYESMPQEEFAEWWQLKVLPYVSEHIWPNIASHEVRQAISEMLGDDFWPADPALGNGKDRVGEKV